MQHEMKLVTMHMHVVPAEKNSQLRNCQLIEASTRHKPSTSTFCQSRPTCYAMHATTTTTSSTTTTTSNKQQRQQQQQHQINNNNNNVNNNNNIK